MYVGRRHDIVGDASAKALGHRAEWCVKGTLVTLPPPLKEPWPPWLVDRRCTPIACPISPNIHNPCRLRSETICRGVVIAVENIE